jgi:hypothetical protein
MEFIAISIEANTLNANAKGLFCDRFAYYFSGFYIAGIC